MSPSADGQVIMATQYPRHKGKPLKHLWKAPKWLLRDQVLLQHVKATVLLDSKSVLSSELVRMLTTLQSAAGRGNGSWTHYAMILKTQAVSALPGGIVKTQMAKAHARIPDWVGLGWGQELAFPASFQVNADTSGLGTTLWESLT